MFGAFFLAKIFEKVTFDPYNFRITRLSARKSERMTNYIRASITLDNWKVILSSHNFFSVTIYLLTF